MRKPLDATPQLRAVVTASPCGCACPLVQATRSDNCSVRQPLGVGGRSRWPLANHLLTQAADGSCGPTNASSASSALQGTSGVNCSRSPLKRLPRRRPWPSGFPLARATAILAVVGVSRCSLLQAGPRGAGWHSGAAQPERGETAADHDRRVPKRAGRYRHQRPALSGASDQSSFLSSNGWQIQHEGRANPCAVEEITRLPP